MCPPLGVGFISADLAAGAGKDTDGVVILALLARAQAAGELASVAACTETVAAGSVREQAVSALPHGTSTSDPDSSTLHALLHSEIGTPMCDRTQQTVGSRPGTDFVELGPTSYGDDLRHIDGHGAPGGLQTDIDLLTARATRFFRKPRHAIHEAPRCPWA